MPFVPRLEFSVVPQFGTRGTDETFSDIYLSYRVGQILTGGSRKRGTSRLSPSLNRPYVFRDLRRPRRRAKPARTEGPATRRSTCSLTCFRMSLTCALTAD